jgi:hypothetical protein
MKKIIILSITVLYCSVTALAQTTYPTKTTDADVALSFGNGFSTAFSYNKLWGLGASKRFKIGAGVRLTSFFGSKLDFTTAPANLTSKPEMVDTVNFASVQSNALNLNIQLQYSFKKLDVGFNIDAIGASFGAGQSGTVAASTSTLNKSTQAAKLSSFNVLLVGDNDLGSLNSELYARYWFTEKIGLRVGGSFQFIEYTTDKVIAFDNQRFRLKTLQPFLALSIRL